MYTNSCLGTVSDLFLSRLLEQLMKLVLIAPTRHHFLPPFPARSSEGTISSCDLQNLTPKTAQTDDQGKVSGDHSLLERERAAFT